MKKALLLAATVAFIAPQAFAQAKSFEGFSVGANLAVANTKTEITSQAVSESGNTTGLDLQAQYSFSLAPQFVLGLGLTLGTGSNKAGTYTFGDVVTKNRLSFDIVPGYAISNTLMVFGKVSSLSADVVATPTGGAENKQSATGIGYGFGVRGMIDKNMFYQVGYDINKYNDIGGDKLSSTVLSLGVGYKF